MKIIKVSSSQGCLNKNIGCKNAPIKIVELLNEIFLNEEGKKEDFIIEDVKIIENNIEETNKNIQNAVEENCIILGGDHSITYPAFLGFVKKFKNPGLVIFDSHPDSVNNFKPPSHEDFLRVLIQNGHIKAENVILVGLRNWDKTEYDFIKDKKIFYIAMKDLFMDIEEACNIIMEKANKFDGFYLSLDIDVVDPAFAPATGYREPGGLTSRDLIYFVHRLKKLKNLKMVDIVEINPDLDFNNITSKLGAKLVWELL